MSFTTKKIINKIYFMSQLLAKFAKYSNILVFPKIQISHSATHRGSSTSWWEDTKIKYVVFSIDIFFSFWYYAQRKHCAHCSFAKKNKLTISINKATIKRKLHIYFQHAT